MLTLVLATPRTGSTTFWQSLKSEWWPEYHPNQKGCPEYFDPLGWPVTDVSKTRNRLYYQLKDFVESDSTVSVAIKLMPYHLPYPMICELLDISNKIYYTVRRNYTDQLKSHIAATVTANAEPRVSSVHLNVDQSFVDNMHHIVSTNILKQVQLYKKFPGDLVILEDRFQDQLYGPKHTISDDIIWPDFDTMSLFGCS